MKVLLICFISVLAHAEPSLLRVQSYVRIFDSEPISLHTLVEKDNLSPSLSQQLRKIKLGSAPKAGEKLEFTNMALAEAIRAAGLKKHWNIQIPFEVVVENKGFDLDQETVERKLLSTWSNQCHECQIKILNVQLPSLPEEYKNKPWELIVDPKLPRGTFSSQLLVQVQPNKKLSYWVNGQMEIYKKVPVLNRSTPMNTRMSQEDIQFENRNITMATDSVPSLKSIVGQRAKFSMNAGDIVWNQSLIREKAIQRGEIVKVSLDEENWSVSIQAQTEQDGYVGDTVNLRNLQTNRMITGRVVDVGRVVVK